LFVSALTPPPLIPPTAVVSLPPFRFRNLSSALHFREAFIHIYLSQGGGWARAPDLAKKSETGRGEGEDGPRKARVRTRIPGPGRIVGLLGAKLHIVGESASVTTGQLVLPENGFGQRAANLRFAHVLATGTWRKSNERKRKKDEETNETFAARTWLGSAMVEARGNSTPDLRIPPVALGSRRGTSRRVRTRSQHESRICAPDVR